MELKLNFQKLSEIEIFRKSNDFGMILISIIIMSPWCYSCWCKQHSIIVADFQQKCCFSALNVDFSWLFILIHVEIGNQTKKQHLLLQNNIISLFLIFNKSVVFRQQMLLFHSNFDFYSNECTDTWKINICSRKTTFF